jgi:hypothetical protein
MRTGTDTRGRKIGNSDYLHLIYRVGDDAELAVWATPSVSTRDTDLWEEQEEVLTVAWTSGSCPPGDYRVLTFANYSSARMGEIERPMPLPAGWKALTKSGSDGLPARGFAVNVLKWYPGTTVTLLAEHITVFAEHWAGEISTAELYARTGYALPEGHPRPIWAHSKVTDANR